MNLEAFVLGTGGMMPLPNRYLTSVLLRREGDLFLFDCGESTQVAMRRLNLRWKKISAIFISHTHADHVTGLPGMLMLSSQVERQEPLFIYGPPKIKEYVEASRRILDMYINYKIIVKEINEAQVVFQGSGYRIRAFPVRHRKPCFGYTLEEESRAGIFYPEKARQLGVPQGPLWARLQSGESVLVADNQGERQISPEMVMGDRRPGRKFSFVTDTLFLPGVAKEVAGSDVFICESMFKQDLEESAREKQHMTSTQAATLARKAGGVGRLGLIHYSPRYTRKDLKSLLAEARAVFKNTFLTFDGQSIDIPYPDTQKNR